MNSTAWRARACSRVSITVRARMPAAPRGCRSPSLSGRSLTRGFPLITDAGRATTIFGEPWRRAASRRSRVRAHAAARSVERVTRRGTAARWMMTSGRWREIQASPSGPVMSMWSKVRSASAWRASARLARLPLDRSSATRTRCPSTRRRSTRCEPMNPAPPTTAMVRGLMRVLGVAGAGGCRRAPRHPAR